VIFTPLRLPGAYVIDLVRHDDDRGFFARWWSRDEWEARGLTPRIEQCSISFNRRRGTLRGMHYQAAPYEEAKLVRCTRGAIYDVVVDLRPAAPTYTQWEAIELTADNRRSVYVPEGVAHGFLTLADETEVSYQISVPYMPDLARGVRWNDPAFGIVWPEPVEVLSPRDASYPDFTRAGVADALGR